MQADRIVQTSIAWVTVGACLMSCGVAKRTLWASTIDDSIAAIFDDGEGSILPYRLFLPPGYDEVDAPLPLVLFLHGAGERGSNNRDQVDRHIDGLISATQSDRFASFLLAPQVPTGHNWTTERAITMELLADVLRNYNVDGTRLYVTGLSLGGFGTFDFILHRPDLFAAAVPMSGGWALATGGGWSLDDAALIRDVPIWFFHGDQDTVVPVEQSRDINDAIRVVDGVHRYTEIPGAGHGIWPAVYNDQDDVLYPWLFDHTTADRVRRPWTMTRQLRADRAAYAVIDSNGVSAVDGFGDATNLRLSASRASVGETDTDSDDSISRLIVKFQLPNVYEASRILKGATLRFFLEDCVGNPTGPVSLYHSVTDTMDSLLPPSSDYENTDYADVLRDLVGPTVEFRRYYELDVTDLVLTDYAMDGDNPLSAFRLQVTGVPFVDDGQGARYRFTMPGAQANHPELLLTFVPEPSTAVLVLLSAIWMTTFGRWRRR